MEEIIQGHLDILNIEIGLAKAYAEKYIECKIKDDSNVLVFKCMAEENLKHAAFIHDIIKAEIPEKYLPQWKVAHDKYVIKTEIINSILN